MRKLKLWCLLIIFFTSVFATNSFAQGIAQVEIALQENGSATVKELYEIDSSDIETFEREISHAKILKITDAQGEITQFSTTETKLQFMPRQKIPKYSFTVLYATQALTEKNSAEWKVSFTPPQGIKILSTKIYLPKTMKVSRTDPAAIVYSSGDFLALEWNDNTQVTASYSAEENETSQNPLTQNLQYIGTLLAILLVGGAVFYYNSKKTGSVVAQMEKAQSATHTLHENADEKILRYLNENEAKIVTKLMETGKPLTQRKLQVELGLPKSSLSRAIKRLEVKGIVKRSEIGNTNLIEIVKGQ